jgi:hypothetical protein
VPRQQHPTNTPTNLPAPKAKRRARSWIPLGVFGALIVVGIVIASTINSGGGSSTPAAGTTTSSATTGAAGYLQTVRNVAPEASKFDDATLSTIGKAVCDQPANQTRQQLITDMASYRQISKGAADTIVTTAVQYLCPSRTWLEPWRTETAAPVPAAAPAPAKAITAREWQLIAKNPTAHVGDRVIVYGEVVQFDVNTGSAAFRANVDGVVHPIKYGYADYETNTFLTAGTGVTLADVVEGDVFKAEVTVAGAYSYDTAMGGSLTAPKLTVTKIQVTGSTK